MLPGPFPTSPSFLNASGVAVNYVTRTFTTSGGIGFSPTGQAVFALAPGQSGSLTYGFSTPLTLADFSTPANTNWLMELNVTSSNLSAFQVTGFVNSVSYGLLTGTGGIINAYFLNAISGNINSLSFRITNTGSSGLETIAINSVSAVPEPASMLTAGAFSLIGALVYRRRKAKKVEALTA
ncbi:MAG: PEP-CTERM sorting domain-containing protein [Planctomycetota bacterium]|nr:PEP-CTERM sorting domain-containing protein [Planctomycetota bacterium]